MPSLSTFLTISLSTSFILSCLASYTSKSSRFLFIARNIFSNFDERLSIDFSVLDICSIFFATSWSIFATFSRPPILLSRVLMLPVVLMTSSILTSSFSIRTSISEANWSRFINCLFIFSGSMSSTSSFTLVNLSSCSLMPASLCITVVLNSVRPSLMVCILSSLDVLASFKASIVALIRSISTLNFSENFCIISSTLCAGGGADAGGVPAGGGAGAEGVLAWGGAGVGGVF